MAAGREKGGGGSSLWVPEGSLGRGEARCQPPQQRGRVHGVGRLRTRERGTIREGKEKRKEARERKKERERKERGDEKERKEGRGRVVPQTEPVLKGSREIGQWKMDCGGGMSRRLGRRIASRS